MEKTYSIEEHNNTAGTAPRGISRRCGRLVRSLLFLMAMTLGATTAWGQYEATQGTYYLASSEGYDPTKPASNWYLVPAGDPQQKTNYIDAYYSPNHATTSGDPEKPFLTTYKTNRDAASTIQDNSIWIVKFAGTDENNIPYYYFIHAATGKYAFYEVPLPNDPNTNTNSNEGKNGKRKVIHLQTPDDEEGDGAYRLSVNNNFKFKIEFVSPYYHIVPYYRPGWYCNPAGGNKNTYYGQNASLYQGGLIGVYDKRDDAGSRWRIEIAKAQAPSINFDAVSGSYTITTHLNCEHEIRYTTDGTTPSRTNGTVYDGSTIVVTEECDVQAIVVGYGMELSTVATQHVTKALPDPPTFEVTCDSKLQINCNVPSASLYYTYTTDGTDPADPDNTSTQWTEPVSIPDDAKVKAIAYNAGEASQVSAVYTFINNTPSPTITLTETEASISFTSGATLYYTTNGSDPSDPDNTTRQTYNGDSPKTITGLSYNANVDIRAVAETAGHGQSCPVTVMKRPKKPTITATSNCDNTERSYTLKLGNTETGNTYWYALSNGSGQPAPALNQFIQYTPGSTVDITTINKTTWNGTDIYVTLHAYAKTEDGFCSQVVSEDYLRKYTAVPTISHTGNSVTITAVTGATIFYTVDGGVTQTATTSTSFTVAEGQNHVVKATAQYGNEGQSCETIHRIILPTTITTLAELQAMNREGAYILGNDITEASSYVTIGTDETPFTGYLDGAGYTISGLTQPLFGTTNGAIIHDVNLKQVNISKAGNVGAIVCDAKGYTRIYNCGILPNDATFPAGTHPSVTATGSGGCAGGIVGKLEGDSRVVNCFSYADVTSSGTGAGIVGNNTYASDASVSNGKYTKLKTMVVNCMFYGNITASSDIYPVYGGSKISNKGNNAINNYNFYSVGCSFSKALKDYNCSWPAQLDYLTRYEFHRNLLNSNRELCGWWVGATDAPSTMKVEDVQAVPKDASIIRKWVLDPSVAPYPILKPFGKYASPVNIDADASWRETANEWEGKKLGTLNVTVSGGAHHSGSKSLVLTITDMDTLRTDYCYKKVQLPYYNSVFGNPNGATWAEKYGDNYGDNVVIGWKVSTSEGTAGTLTEHWQTGYNFADRNCTAKDANRVFAQGGYYYVPDGVENITITAQWAQATYVDNSDHSYDRVNMSGSKTGTHFAPAGYRPSTLGNGKTVSTSNLRDLATASTGDVFNRAVVLVGNHQYRHSGENIGNTNSTTGFTVMSSDFDFDEEPDHCLIWQLGQKYGRQSFCPIRFDFLPIEEMGLAMKEDGSTQYYSLGCYRPLGHFEVTETSLIHFGQFEFSNKDRSLYAPLILNGGIFDQYTKGTNGNAMSNADDKITYIIIGGNVKMPSFTPGAHVNSNSNFPTRHCAVNVIGGNIDYLYLTGNYHENVKPNKDDPHCYIDGGWFKQVAAAGKEGIDGDVTFKINHAKIEEFYGGSTMDQATGNNFKIVKGSIDVTIDNSIVKKYCGGPKFGDMVYDAANPTNSKTITTNANNTTFMVYYGGGNGGTSYVQYDKTDVTGDYGVSSGTYDWNGTGNTQGHLSTYDPGAYRSEGSNYMADYDMEIVNISTGTEGGQAVCRTYFYAAQFSATNTGPVTNNLTNCTVLTNFYGGGNLGGVNGDITSTLTGTHVYGSAFGAGYSASVPEVKILQSGTKTPPTVNVKTGIITPQSGGTYDTYTWSNDESLSTDDPISENKFFTEVPLTNLGAVSGNVTLTIDGSSVVEGNDYTINSTDLTYSLKENGANVGGVFGGGDESMVSGTDKTVQVNINTTSDNHATKYINHVFGGGNNGDVASMTEVNVVGSSYVKNNVYGGGKGQTTVVSGDVVVNIGEATTQGENTTYSGNATIGGNVYGGSALGNTNATKGTGWTASDLKLSPVEGKTTHVNLYGGNVTNNVFGGGLGQRDPAIASNVYGPDTVTVEGGTAGNVFGCNDQYGAPQSTAAVVVHGTAVPESPATYAIGNVYGGGNLAAYTGTPTVTMSGGTVNKVYGGGYGASAIITGNTSVTLSGGTVVEDVYGGGDAANVTDSVKVSITGGVVMHDVYGGGALANTNTATTTVNDKTVYPGTIVSLTGGTIRNVYGGGLGRKAATGVEAVEAKSGNVLVELNKDVPNSSKGCVVQQVFGCNNLNGTPLGTDTVRIFKTQNAEAQHIAGQEGDKVLGRYDVAAVYGGGDLAAYNPANAATGKTVVEIYGCAETSIEYVYGGGNAAPVPATDVTIDSAFDIYNVFGGGNGSDPDKPGADVGIIDADAYAADNTTGIYGTGKAVTKLIGGTINTVYGGSNTKGNVRGGTSLSMPRKNDDCPLNVTAIYGAGQNAEQSGVSEVVIGCASGLQNIYGGAKDANVGGVNLVITGGDYKKVFGGNDTSGTIQGPITVTIEETDECPLTIDSLFLGGNLAPYSVYGYKDTDSNPDDDVHTLVARTSMSDGDAFNAPAQAYSADQLYRDPVLNVVSCTSIGKVFGGGLGSTATMYGSPTVNINMIPGSQAALIDRDDDGDADGEAHRLGTIGNVYGGGSEADVEGNTTVNINTEATILSRTERNEFVEGVYITGNIYGGGLSANVIGDTHVNIGTVDLIGPNANTYEGVQITGDVFGGGEGSTTMVTDSVTVAIGDTIRTTTGISYIGNASITGNVYGGSALGSVNAYDDNGTPTATPDAKTSVTLFAGSITGSVFGGGKGRKDDPNSEPDAAAQNFGNTTVRVEGGTVSEAVYGGSNINGELKGNATVTILGGTINTAPDEGDPVADVVFGGGFGQHTGVDGDVEVNIGTDTGGTLAGTATIHGSVYGGSAQGKVNGTSAASNTHTTQINLNQGTVNGDIYGGGLGTASIAADVYGLVTVTTKSGTAQRVFGCNNVNGAPQQRVDVNIEDGTISGDVYGGGNQAAYSGTDGLFVAMSGGSASNVFGGGLGSTAVVTGNSSVTVSGNAAVTDNIYGGGSEADLTGNASVTVSGGSAKTVYGGGNLANVSGKTVVNITGGTLSGTDFNNDGTVIGAVFGGGYGNTTTVGDSVTVNIGARALQEGSTTEYNYSGSAVITGDVYGGSAKGKVNTTDGSTLTTDATTNVNLYGGRVSGSLYGGGLGDATYAANVYGPVKVTTTGGKAGNVFGCNNINGAPQSTVRVDINGADSIGNVYGGGNQAPYTGSPIVNMTAGTVNNVYGSGLGSTADVTGSTTVTIAGGMVNNNVYGGGDAADVTQNVNVTVSGGYVKYDVYGGGALANTNTENWNSNSSDTRDFYLQVYGLAVGESVSGLYKSGYIPATGTAQTGVTYYQQTTEYTQVPEGLITVGTTDVSTYYYTEDEGATYKRASGTAAEDVTYYQESIYYSSVNVNVGADVSTYYTKQDNYTAASGTAEKGVKYYQKKTLTGTWATGKNDASTGTTYKTTVRLIGGKVGNVYGGGLGDDDTPAFVFGDVTVTMGDSTDATVGATAFTRERDIPASTATGSAVYKTGHLFGANNVNGTPTGNITVNVFKTRHADHNGHLPGTENSSNFEIQGVYGGGNLADYMPVSGKETRIYIDGCSNVSIEFVYGGGNSAAVPATNVNIVGCWEIGYAFGGGNGNDKILKSKNDSTSWYFKGADVNGDTYITLHGGTIHWAFGGSNRLGDCTGTIHYSTLSDNDDCPLKITTMYGAGQNADVSGSLDLVIKCPSNAIDSYIENVYGGSLNAKISGSVTMTIIGGIYENIYGGNDQSGSIGGPITINIQETSDCQPVVIKKLFGGGNKAAYPKEGGSGGSIKINVKSCTRIGTIYGGGHEAEVNGNTEVNVNMVKGHWAGHDNVSLPIAYKDIPNIENVTVNGEAITCKIKNEIGTIGTIFGGGDQGNINGNTTVNIGTWTNDTIHTYNVDNIITATTYPVVLGAHITDTIYGGGNLADVTGNTYVNICAKETAKTNVYESVTEGADSVIIGGCVFGGGKGVADNFFCDKAMVGVNNDNQGDYSPLDSISGTHINIGHGTVRGTVYGGGQIGRVEYNTEVTIGYGNGTGASKTPIVEGEVYAAGKGVNTHGYSALVRGNSKLTIQGDAKVGLSVYGGGEMASVGKYQVVNGMPQALAFQNLGNCYVTVKGQAEIGPNNMVMPRFTGHVFGAGKGAIPYEGYEDTEQPFQVLPATTVYYKTRQAVGESVDSAYMTFIETLALATKTEVTIGGQAFVKGSVYGGSENGHVQHDTQVTIQDSCQIGNGDGVNRRYTKQEWAGTSLAECAHWDYDNTSGAPYDKYATYQNPTDNKYYYDAAYTKYAEGGAAMAKGGHTYYGNVFGGGSGVVPYNPGKWHREAGSVSGDAKVIITGGHILTSVYGGNEQTDVAGDAYIIMTGGTLGVPRTLAQIAAHPVTCYLFGAGKGDQRIFFNTWTNVRNAYIHISDSARIFGSVFGGGEDGHVLGDVKMNVGSNTFNGLIPDSILTHNPVIKALSLSGTKTVGAIQYPYIGTTGTSYVDGNIFGGGRGFSGEALTAGTIGGNVDVDIKGGTMLGSIYGGGRLASVGTYFTDPNDPEYGQLKEDDDDNTYGHITVNISGGTIGNTTLDSNVEGIEHSGNVFGGSMGRLTLLDGTTLNPLWPELAEAKTAVVNITGDDTRITRNVYGGGEFGTVRENAYVTIGGTGDTSGTVVPDGTAPIIGGSVFGGGYGSDIYDEPTTIEVHWSGATAYYTYTPMQWAGSVGGNTFVNICDGTIGKNVYGGGELASVGIVDYSVKPDENGPFTYTDKNNNENHYSYKTVTKHADIVGDGTVNEKMYGFALSWPYEFKYVPCSPTDTEPRGVTTVNVIDGTIGGYVFGAGKGKVDFGGTDSIKTHRYKEAYCANVRKSNVTIGSSSGTPTILHSVYGGGEDGHVYEDASVTIENGEIKRSVFGGGKGESKYQTVLWDKDTPGISKQKNNTIVKDSVYSWTAGKVYGNTTVTMNDGSVGMFIYGGGNLGSVGKGSYSGGSDDYATAGYGEMPENADSKLWTTSSTEASETKDMAYHFLKSGQATINLFGGRVGPASGTAYDDDGIPYGSVFGGSRGRAAMDVGKLSPRYRYVPDFFLGYVNNAFINIGDTTNHTTDYGGPTVKGSVYGGGQDGHVRSSTAVRVFTGNIEGQNDSEKRSGHVFGAGSGIGRYTDTDDKEKCSNSSGSVTCTTLVEVNGGEISGNVYGGGAMASVGPPKMGPDELKAASGNHKSYSYTKVDVKGGTILGDVFAASRGPSDKFRKELFTDIEIPYDSTKFATDIWSEVNVSGGTIGDTDSGGSVYGGGETGYVKCGVNVNITGGIIKKDVYGGGARANTNTSNWDADNNTWASGKVLRNSAGKDSTAYQTMVRLLGGRIYGDAYGGGLGRKAATGVQAVEAMVYGDVTVELNNNNNGDNVRSDTTGCIVNRIFGCNNLNGTPKGHAKVHVYATQNKHATKPTIVNKFAKDDGELSLKPDIELKPYLADKIMVATALGIDVSGYQDTYNNGSFSEIRTAIANISDAITAEADTEEENTTVANLRYDVQAVYGGGNLSPYEPADAFLDYETNKAKVDSASTEVIIDGCDLTSIRQVYGGGNAASVSASHVRVNGTYEIEELFGGGNGKDDYTVNNQLYENPGANVGYKNYTTPTWNATLNKYEAEENYDASTKETRQTYYGYGSGVACTEVLGGRIHIVYGGSNKKGNIRTTTMSMYESMDESCSLKIDESYGAGKDASQDGDIELTMNCVREMEEIFGGAKNADVNADVELTITNGSHFKRVFGGNNTSGAITGSITVNIEESGCEPIMIEHLYAGGYLAPYSVYGYKPDGHGGYLTKDSVYEGIGTFTQSIPFTKAEYEAYIPTLIDYKKSSLVKLGFGENDNPTEAQIAAVINNDPSLRQWAIQLASINEMLNEYPKKDPRINIISATRIDTVFGGGYKALVVGSPHINVNMTGGKMEVISKGTEDEPYYEDVNGGNKDENNNPYTAIVTSEAVNGKTKYFIPLTRGTIGTIYGGGNLADIAGDTYLEIGTGEWLNGKMQREMLGTAKINNKDSLATFTYDDTLEKWTYIRKDTVFNQAIQKDTVISDTLSIEGIPIPARNEATITGDVFGGGKGVAKASGARAFFCDAAMIGIDGEGKTDPDGGTSIIIENGTVDGNVYGGGEVGRVEKNTKVTIGKEGDQTNEPEIKGSVFGAGKGVNTHGYSALVRGNTTVTVQGQAKVKGSVYGGGELASVGRYNVADKNAANFDSLQALGIEDGMPYSLVSSLSGNCNVIVRDYAEIGPDNMKMTAANGPDNAGHVFGAGKGVVAYEGYDATHLPWRMPPSGVKEEYNDTTAYLKYLKTLALATQTSVIIGGHAFVKGDVFGGGEDGYVQHDTHVTIQDSCQIGNGYILLVNNGDTIANYGVNRRYTDEEWKQGKLIGDDRWTTASLPECAHWPYGIEVDEDGVTKKIFAQYDKFANKTGNLEQYSNGTSTGHGRFKGSDGHTFYGNVFGGGSGYFPYAPGKWNHNAGYIGGNTHVTITGGHILTNVYGGNEMTDVRDTCFIKMTGGTLGVPRTLEQIAAHPVTCYLFGGGMGDPRTFFNKHTNVGSVDIEISGGHIYGSVFGGAEDGHVEHDVKIDIKPGAKIGTWGTSYVDGNVFGGGRGFSGEALTAGNVGDSVVINITGGKMLGSIYGGGRLGSVGYDLKDVNEAGYGKLSTDPTRGHVVINISGGTIGNDHEYTYIAPNATESQVAAAKVNMPNTLHDADNRLQHTKGGNVFTGGMGRFYLLDDSTVISHWYDLGKVKSTRLTVSDSARIKSNIYGGCELGWVGGKHKVDGHAHADSLSTEILIKGGTSASPVIGTEIKDNSGITRYTFGSVFGGGRGSNMEKLYKDENEAIVSDNPKFYAGRVVGSTDVKMEDGLVLGSVYGGGQVGNIGMASSYGEVADSTVSSNVTITGGTIGRDTLIVAGDTIRFGGATMGNVYGGGSGDHLIVRCGLVLGNSNVNISQAEGKTTRIYHNVYGGGAYGTVGDFEYDSYKDESLGVTKVFGVNKLATDSTGIANVTITGGEIGIDGHNNGMIFGSSRGDVVGSQLRDDYMAWVYDANVRIGNNGGGFKAPEPRIHGSIYGGGENGHVLRDTHVDILSGYIGDSVSYYANRGNVYGAGCGTDTIMVAGVKRYKPLAGVVHGNTNVNISGGLITGGIYGAGSMAYVGTISNKNDTASVAKHMDIVTENGKENIYGLGLSWPYKFEFVDTTGTATINITGGHIGINGTDGGDVYGSARGEAGDRYITAHHAFVKEAIINIDLPRTASVAALDTLSAPCITGSVHGSGEDGYVYGDTYVTLNKGLIGHSVYGGGKGKGTYKMTLDRWSATGETGTYEADIYSLISGKVLGNTYVTMNDGHVVRNIYGGGNMGSVGKGNYAGAADDYFTGGYGELTRDSLWSNHNEYSQAFLNSGKTTVKVLAGTVGNPNKLTEFKEGLPLGNVFGGSRGVAAPNVPNTLSPRYYYCPTFFSGYVNETEVIIGTDSTAGPTILCSVYGGAQDGHVRRWTDIKVYSGTIGLPFTAENKSLMGKDNINDSLWLYRGNVYGAGSGISEFKYDFNGKNGYADTFKVVGNNGTTLYPERGYSTSAGSVTCFTKVDIKGGTIYRNVAGGGSLASVGPLRIRQPDYAAIKVDGDSANWGKQSLNEVIIGGKTDNGKLLKPIIGTREGVATGYGGNIFGGSRGEPTLGSGFATSVWTKVYVKDGASIFGSIFGGGDNGTVYKDTDVQIGEPKSE